MILLNALVCALITIRIMLVVHGHRHRPRISFIAYLLAVSAGIQSLMALMGMTPNISFSQLTINIILLSALICQHGNVANLFKSNSATSKFAHLLLSTKCNKKRGMA